MSKIGRLKLLSGLCFGGVATSAFFMHTKNEWCWENINMPLIRILSAERAHELAVKVAAWGLVPSFKTSEKDKDLLKTSLFGLEFESPLGLSAGFDKNAECYNGMLKMGFSFVEVGSITPQPQVGNNKPRLFRLSEDKAVINRYGFNSYGHQEAEDNIKRVKPNGILGVNLGKNKTSEDAVDDYVKGVLKLGPYADYIVINVSSPNTPGLRRMQGREMLSGLLEKVLSARCQLDRQPPLLVKIAPDLTREDREDIAAVITDSKTQVDGLIVTNTTIKRPPTLRSDNKNETGGLSGEPLKNLATQAIRDMYLVTEGKVPIIGVGGIANGEDAFEKIKNGASLVQLYSSLSLEGPPVVGRVKRELAELLRVNSFTSVKDAVGADVQLSVIDK